ncbi:MAG TPA: cache domain-containing protein, partial [Verrucomicrobiae bacterium]|nr:cache domain-containing protein [Verrucomicrobiae bacterium]
VLGRSTGKPGAIVAVPVRAADGKIVGLVGSAIDLAQLTVLLQSEMGNGPGTVFWAIDAHGITALHSDPTNIFNDAAKMSPELKRAITHMLATDSGVENYSYKGKARTVVYRKSTLTGWTYGFGVVH